MQDAIRIKDDPEAALLGKDSVAESDPSYTYNDVDVCSDGVGGSDDGPIHQQDEPLCGCMTRQGVRHHMARWGLWWCLLAALAASATVFVPWYVTTLNPRYALMEHTRASMCTVMNHTIVATKRTRHDPVIVKYVPGLWVWFQTLADATAPSATHTDNAHAHKHGGRVYAMALPRFLIEQSWMDQKMVDDYWAKYPAGSTARCFYDDEAPDEAVAMRPGIDRLGLGLLVCILVTLLVFVLVFAIIAVPLHAWAGIGRQTMF